MAFLDKINQVAKNIGDKTNDAIENTKLTQKINSEKGAAGEEFKKIGEYYYNVFLSGGEVAPEVQEACKIITEQLEAERAAREAAEQARRQAEGAPCPVCGTKNEAGVKFCRECGAKMAAEQPEQRLCPQCGATVRAGKKFCTECGCKMEE